MSEALSLTFEYWDDMRGDRIAPLEADLNPAADIPSVARQTQFVDVERVGNRRRFRGRPRVGNMAGSRDGDYFDERLSGDLLERTLSSSNRVCESGAPQFVVIDPTTDFPYFYCRLCVPVSRDGAGIDVQLHAVDVLSPYDR